jgi:hypothetical protein
MGQVAIYVNDKTIEKLDRAAKKDGMSRSAWVRMAVEEKLRNRLPESFFETLGTWEDPRDADAILADIRTSTRETPRAEIE